MQALVTRFLPATDNKDARVAVRCDAGRDVFPWRSDLSMRENHDAAAIAMADRLGWVAPYFKRMVRGSLPQSSHPDIFAYCFIEEDNQL